MIINKLKTVILLSCLTGLFLFFGGLFGGKSGIEFALIMALVFNGIAYFYSDKIVLKLYKAESLDKVRYNRIYEIVEELATKMHLPMPKLWLINTPMANAFATGRNPKNASVAVTTGILSILNETELRGVLAHELSHVKNRDILVSTIAATMAAAIGYLANMFRYAAIWGSNSDRKKSNPLGLLIVSILVPIAATLIQLAVSRSREYLADETGAMHSEDPLALARALEKLQMSSTMNHWQDDTAHASTASLFIVNPFNGSSLVNLFSTHPPLEKRIAKLRNMYQRNFMDKGAVYGK